MNTEAYCSSWNPVWGSLVAKREERASRNPSFMLRVAMKVSRSRWYRLLRRIFHHQNGSGSESGSHLGPNPFDSKKWMLMEFITLIVQVTLIAYFLIISTEEKPAWLMRIWVSGYGFACFLSLVLLCSRFWYIHLSPEADSCNFDIELQRIHGESSTYIQKLKTWLELLFAIWFLVGSVWMLDARFNSFHHGFPKLRMLCISLLCWKLLTYIFPFILFLIFCCFVPLVNKLIGYNMNTESSSRHQATDEQLAGFHDWHFKGSNNLDQENSASSNQKEQDSCCICLNKYKENEEIRELQCGHNFHIMCVNQWLKIMACCPLCKKCVI